MGHRKPDASLGISEEKMKLARNSCGEPHQCQYDWPENCFVQCGGTEKYGFFFEAFPRTPDTFLRGDSKVSVAEAETLAWNRLQKYSACELDHANPDNFERRSYKNGVGFCIKCGFFASKIFPPSEICSQCGGNTYHAQDNTGKWWCEECWKNVPDALLTSFQKSTREFLANEAKITDEELQEGIAAVCKHILEQK